MSPLSNLFEHKPLDSKESYQSGDKAPHSKDVYGFKKGGNTPMITRYAPYPFLTVGIAFIAIGATGQRTLLYVGIVFLVLALVMVLKFRKPN